MKSDQERFLAKITIDSKRGCWVWTGSRMIGQLEYGRFVFEKTVQFAHRVSWKLHVSAIPEDKLILHKCDNPPCVNPEHLFLGTHTDNMRDMIAKNRYKNPNSMRTHCPHGHPYSGENLRIKSDGSRGCNTCIRAFERTRGRLRRRETPKSKTCKNGHDLAGENLILSSNKKRMCRICLTGMAYILNKKRWSKNYESDSKNAA